MAPYTVYLNFLEQSIRLHLRNCAYSIIATNRDAGTQGWWKDFDSLEAAISEMESAAKFCQTANFGPCKQCNPFQA
jgi:hypothetical protein